MANCIKSVLACVFVVGLLVSGCETLPRYTRPAPDTYDSASAEIDLNGQTSKIVEAKVARTFFQSAGVSPLLGRGFIDGDFDGPTRVAVLSEELCRDSFGADPTVIGKALRLSGSNVIIVGVMPAGFVFPKSVGVWVPRGAAK